MALIELFGWGEGGTEMRRNLRSFAASAVLLTVITGPQAAQHHVPAYLLDELPVDRHTGPGVETEHVSLQDCQSIARLVK